MSGSCTLASSGWQLVAVSPRVVDRPPYASDSSSDVPLASSITLGFNLATDPAAVKSFLTVLVGEVGYSVIPGSLAQGKTANEIV